MRISQTETDQDAKTESQPVDAPEERGEEKESFGVWLRRQRELREITLREIADTSKISLRYLQALEDERFDLLPAAVFAKGFLRQYASYVGIDPEETVNFFLDRCQEEEEDEQPAPTRRPQTMATWTLVLVFMVLAIILMSIVWAILRLDQSRRENAEPAPSVSTTEVPAAEVASPLDLQVAVTPVAETPAATEPATGAAAAPSTAAPSAVAPSTEAPSAEAALPLQLVLDFRGECWVESLVDGRRWAAREYIQGESLRLAASATVDLEIGDARAVDLQLNGSPLMLEDGMIDPETMKAALRIDLETAKARMPEAPILEGYDT